MKSRIQLTDDTMTAMIKMSDGNPGAATVLMELMGNGKKIDPDSALGGLGAVLSLDTHGIYGTDIWVLYSDICGKDLAKTMAVLRAVQLGILDENKLQDACGRQDYSGRKIINADEMLAAVKEKLPNFAKEMETA